MRLSLLMFIVGTMFVTAGYTLRNSSNCKSGTDVRIVPRNVYDQIISESTL